MKNVSCRLGVVARWVAGGLLFALAALTTRAGGGRGGEPDATGFVLPPLELPGLEELVVAHVPSLADPPRPREAAADVAPGAPASTTVEQHATFVAFVRAFAGTDGGADRAGAARGRARALQSAGEPGQAVAVLLAAEAEGAGDRANALALSLAYEQDGRLEDAILWVARAVERSDGTAAGDEWLIAAILRARLRLRADRHWLEGHALFDDAGERAAEEWVQAIDRQAGVRVPWTPVPDVVMAELYRQAAWCLTAPDEAERRGYYLREARRFRGNRDPGVSPQRKT